MTNEIIKYLNSYLFKMLSRGINMVGVGLGAAAVLFTAKYIQSEHCDHIIDFITRNTKILTGKCQ